VCRHDLGAGNKEVNKIDHASTLGAFCAPLGQADQNQRGNGAVSTEECGVLCFENWSLVAE
jgi:hypothetical protein